MIYVTSTFATFLVGYLAFAFFRSIYHNVWWVYLYFVRLSSFHQFAEIYIFSCFDFMSVRMLKREKVKSRRIIRGFFQWYGGYDMDEDEYECKTGHFLHKYHCL